MHRVKLASSEKAVGIFDFVFGCFGLAHNIMSSDLGLVWPTMYSIFMSKTEIFWPNIRLDPALASQLYK